MAGFPEFTLGFPEFVRAGPLIVWYQIAVNNLKKSAFGAFPPLKVAKTQKIAPSGGGQKFTCFEFYACLQGASRQAQNSKMLGAGAKNCTLALLKGIYIKIITSAGHLAPQKGKCAEGAKIFGVFTPVYWIFKRILDRRRRKFLEFWKEFLN